MIIKVEIEREEDGRWIVDAVDMPGIMVYGYSRDEAIARMLALVEKLKIRPPRLPPRSRTRRLSRCTKRRR